MKKILFCLLLILSGAYLAAQSDEYIYQLPEYTSVVNDSTHVMYIDAGGIDKHIEMPTLLGVVHDSIDVVRNEVDTAKANIRASIGGGGSWSQTGNKITLTDPYDTIGIGTAPASGYKVTMTGSLKVADNIATMDTVKFIGPFNTGKNKIYGSGDNLMLYSTNTGAVSLQTLKNNVGIFTLLSNTYYPPISNNYNFGGNTTTTYKLKVTGDFNVTGSTYLGDANYDTYIQGVLRLTDRISWSDYGGRTLDADNYGFEFKNLDNSVGNKMYIDFFYPDRFEIRNAAYSGITFFDDNGTYGDGIMFKVNDLWYLFDGTYFRNETDTLGFGGGGGGDISDGGTANDTIWLGYVQTSNKTRWVGISHTKGLYADSTNNASQGLTNPLPSIYDFMRDTLNGELNWSTYTKGIETKYRGIDKMPSMGYILQSLQDGIEKNYRYNLSDKTEIDELKKQVLDLQDQVKSLSSKKTDNSLHIGLLIFMALLCLILIIKR